MRASKESNDNTLIISFNEEEFIPDLFGLYDKNLHRIETLLNVNLQGRGKNISISGKDILLAKDVLNDLYAQLKKGFDIGFEEVDASIRMNSEKNISIGKQQNDLPLIRTKKKTVRARTHKQNEYIIALNKSELTFGVGPAGTGKTFLPVVHAVELLEKEEISKIILSRPAVEAGEKLGFLPGDLKDKVDPYLRPLYDALEDVLPFKKLEKYLEIGVIEIAPLAFMRGRTLSNSYIILDEAQNTNKMQMKMFLTRLGFNSRMVITGDITQIDLPNNISSGLSEALKITSLIKEKVSHVYFGEKDVVRHHLVQKIVNAYERSEKPIER
ncbi:MAG: phosphate starvation-inducible protein PhoH [Pelagibacterales bacterium]|nr:phosphate starvation-inducible protein PhoH [Pelagibacterales bacterium]PPR16067.1 MAG: PhoH-like protein [Alphaproteobacteria bacterium MarineAlpha9_Bin3]